MSDGNASLVHWPQIVIDLHLTGSSALALSDAERSNNKSKFFIVILFLKVYQ